MSSFKEGISQLNFTIKVLDITKYHDNFISTANLGPIFPKLCIWLNTIFKI